MHLLLKIKIISRLIKKEITVMKKTLGRHEPASQKTLIQKSFNFVNLFTLPEHHWAVLLHCVNPLVFFYLF